MARAGLGWSINKMATVTGMHPNTITRFENGKPVLPVTVRIMRLVLENEGVEFLDDPKAPGIRIRTHSLPSSQ
jgi:transcriptional regulator with XRE-family HTH domain